MSKDKEGKEGKDLLKTIAEEQQKGDHNDDGHADNGKGKSKGKKNKDRDEEDQRDDKDNRDRDNRDDEDNREISERDNDVLKVKFEDDNGDDNNIDFESIVDTQLVDTEPVFTLAPLPVIKSVFSAPQATVQPVQAPIVPEVIIKPIVQTVPETVDQATVSAPTQVVVQEPVVNLFSDLQDNISFGTNSISSVSAKEGVTITQAVAADYTDGTQYNAGAGDDVVILPYSTGDNGGFAVNSQLHLGAGDDSAYGAYYHGAEVFGDAGNDYIEGSRVHGGDGDDTIHANDGTGIDFTFGDAGNDTIFIWGGDGTVDAGAGVDKINAKNGTAINAHGGADNDQIFGDTANDTMYGDAGNDKLVGRAGNDTLDGGTGDDVLRGGDGNDVFVYRVGSDGFDTIYGGILNGADNSAADRINLLFDNQTAVDNAFTSLNSIVSGTAFQQDAGYTALGLNAVDGVEQVNVYIDNTVDDMVAVDMTVYDAAIV